MLRSAALTGATGEAHRATNDYYPTPAAAVQALLEREPFPGRIWEPACGDGAISRFLPPDTLSTDLVDRGYGVGGVDFLQTYQQVDHVITNPPFLLAQAFVEHALTVARQKVAMLLKLNFLEGQGRYALWQGSPLRTVYVFPSRLSFGADGHNRGKGLLAYAWFVWEQGYQGPPMLAWMAPFQRNKRRRQP